MDKMKRMQYFKNDAKYECIECKEAISNPLCPSCLGLQIEVWLSSLSSYPLKYKIMSEMNNFLTKTRAIDTNYTTCVSCGKPTAYLCPYCFTNYVYNMLKKMKVNIIVLREFLQFFNFDLHHTGYSKEAEKLGLI